MNNLTFASKTDGDKNVLRVSVALCTFNGDLYLKEQIESILQQSSKVHEIVISDDGSTDQTKGIINQYKIDYPAIFKLNFHDRAVGTIRNFQTALEKCTGDVVFLSDQDDIWHPDKVAIMLRSFRDPRCLLLFTNGTLVDGAGNSLHSTLWDKWSFTPLRRLRWLWSTRGALIDLLRNNNKVTGATVAMRASLLEVVLPIRTPPHYWHDAWFALHAAARGGLRFIPNLLINYRMHPKQQVGITKGGNSSPAATVSREIFLESFKKEYPAWKAVIERPEFRPKKE